MTTCRFCIAVEASVSNFSLVRDRPGQREKSCNNNTVCLWAGCLFSPLLSSLYKQCPRTEVFDQVSCHFERERDFQLHTHLSTCSTHSGVEHNMTPALAGDDGALWHQDDDAFGAKSQVRGSYRKEKRSPQLISVQDTRHERRWRRTGPKRLVTSPWQEKKLLHLVLHLGFLSM